MTVPSAINKSGPYTGNGVTTSFAYGFRILDQSHIRVVRTENGNDTILTTGFTVTGVGAAGGSVVFSVAPTAAQTITLIRNAPFVQQTDLENQGAYYAQTIEDALDLGVMRDQQLQEQVDRSVKIPVGAATFDLDALVTDIVRVADSVAAVDTVAANIADVDTVATNIDDVGIVADNIVDVTNFADVYQGPKSVAPVLRNNGGPLLSGDLYFDTVENRMKVRASAAWVNAASSVNGMIAQYAYTATAGQTVFAAVYDIGFVTVYLNGVKLVSGDDFTALNGTSITLATGAAVGDSIEIIGFGAFATADMLQKSQNGADIPDKAAFLTNLGFSGFVAGLRSAADAAAARTGLGATTVGAAVFTAADAAAARTAIGAVSTGGDTITGVLNLSSTFPALDINDTGAPANGRRWRFVQFVGSANNLLLQALDEAGNTGQNALEITRSGTTVTAFNIPNGQFRIAGRDVFPCLAWVNFNGTNGAIAASGNVSSVVRNAAGDYTINFNTAMPDANYSAQVTSSMNENNIAQQLAGSLRINTRSANGTVTDATTVTVAIFR
jgi:hypothetical protein